MKKLLLPLLLTLGLTINGHTSTQKQHAKAMSETSIKKMDRKLTKHKARSRNFKTPKEFNRKQHRHMNKTSSKHMNYQGYNYNNQRYRDDYRPTRQRAYQHSKRGWILAYQYDRASFYDNEGYFYGYFNRHGYYFEDVFYRYDRYYSYRDRIRGRGLFNRRYFMPVNARYYGFERGFERNRERNREGDYNRDPNRY